MFAPVPVAVTAPGERVNVQAPVTGNPVSSTCPVGIKHVGCVIVPITGADGTNGCARITTFTEAIDVQRAALVMVKLYIPVERSEIVVVDPVPVNVSVPG